MRLIRIPKERVGALIGEKGMRQPYLYDTYSYNTKF